MTTIDQRILIPAAPDAVWDVISNINKNPNWQEDCQEVSFLSSRQTGPGTRWRYASASREEYVVEITAWYDKLGYEYTFIDGVPFQESRGRIRLQEIPEGTIVQWSLTYALGGVFSGLRNSLSIQRKFEKTMVESLKALYTHVRKSGTDRDVSDAKSLMRDAPDYEARSQYTPRHPSRYAERTSEPSGDSEPLIPEPALTEDDTRPNPALTAAEAGDSTPTIREPVELEPVTPPEPAEPIDDEALEIGLPNESINDRFKPPAKSPAGSATQTETDEEATVVEAAAPEPDQMPETAAADQSEAASAPSEPAVLEQAADSSDVWADTEAEPVPAAGDLFGPKIDTSDLDTKEISIWEVFDVPRPSDTQPVQTVKVEQAESPTQPETNVLAAETPVKPADTQPVAAESTESNTKATAEVARVPDVEEPTAASPTTTPEVAAPEVAVVATPPAIRLGPLPPIPPLPYGFRYHIRRKLVKLRRRA